MDAFLEFFHLVHNVRIFFLLGVFFSIPLLLKTLVQCLELVRKP